jgi:hypothetical protein
MSFEFRVVAAYLTRERKKGVVRAWRVEPLNSALFEPIAATFGILSNHIVAFSAPGKEE